MILLFGHSPSVIKPSQAMGTGRLNGDRLLIADLWMRIVRLLYTNRKMSSMQFAFLYIWKAI